MTHKKVYQKVSVLCDCGIKIFGNSDLNVNANLKLHSKSKLHKKQMGNN